MLEVKRQGQDGRSMSNNSGKFNENQNEYFQPPTDLAVNNQMARPIAAQEQTEKSQTRPKIKSSLQELPSKEEEDQESAK